MQGPAPVSGLLVAVITASLLTGCGGGGNSGAVPTARPVPVTPASPSPAPSFDVTALAQAFAGVYQGSWTNTTFGTTGSVTADIKIDAPTRSVAAVVTIGGNVFGGPAPAPETFSGKIADLTSLSFNGHSATFGDFTVAASIGGFTMKAVNIPGDRADHLDVAGTLDPRAINATYTVTMKDGSRAAGAATLTRT